MIQIQSQNHSHRLQSLSIGNTRANEPEYSALDEAHESLQKNTVCKVYI